MLDKSGILIVISVGLLLVTVVVLVIPYRKARSKAYQELVKVPSTIVETQFGPIETVILGSGEPVLIVHGSAGGVDQALDLAADVPAGHRVIAPSRFGYLGSPMPAESNPDDQAQAFVGLLDALGVEEAAVMAYSAGGPSALLLAQNYPEPVSSLVLISTAMADKELNLPPKAVMSTMVNSDFIFWLISHPLRKLSQRMFVPAGLETSAAAQAEIDETMEALLPIEPRSSGLLFDMYVTNLDSHERSDAYQYAEVEVPTLIINAKDDPAANFEDARRMAQSIPGAEFLVVESGGHLMLDNGRRVQRAIDRFFEQNVD